MTHKILTMMFPTLFLIIASCASHTAVYPDPVNIKSVIKPGDTVKVVTKDNQETEFVVTEVTDKAIIGENIKVPLNDITGMKQETVSARENLLIITIESLGYASREILFPPAEYSIVSGKEASPESKLIKSTTKAVSDWIIGCTPYFPMYHPGDEYATESGGIEYIGIDERLCIEKCDSGYQNTEACRFECIEKGHPIGDIAEHFEGGYYSDGSYYANCESDRINPFQNLHPTKDKYEKSKWQKDRDECMNLTFENVKPSFLNQIGMRGFLNRSIKYYRECLNERGYSIKLY